MCEVYIMNKRYFVCLLAALLLATSCGNTVVEDTDITTDTSVSDTVDTETEEDIYTDLGDYDFDGATFTISYCESQLGESWPYEAEEVTGNVVNDAVWERDVTIEDRYNVDIVWQDSNGNEDIASLLRTSITAGDDAYQLGLGHMFSGINALLADGGLYDFNALPIIDQSKPWWSAHLPKTLTVNGKLMIHVSGLVYTFSDCIYFSKDMLKDYSDLPDPYTLVDEGTWTWDVFTTMAQAVSVDLNGDGVFDENDQYGYALSQNPYVDANWTYANGMTIATVQDGTISIDNVLSERMVSTLEKMYNLVRIGNQTYIPKTTGKERIEDAEMFLNGQVLFHENITTLLPLMRDAEIDFGIVPVPKFDETQEEYYSMATTQMMLVPITIQDTTFEGVLLEALSMESYRTVHPAVYEISFSAKYLRDERSYEMYNIIRNTGVYDFNWNYGNGNAFAQIMATLVRNGDPSTLSSFYEKNRSSVLTTLTDVYEDICEAGK